jgi:Kelch motif
LSGLNNGDAIRSCPVESIRDMLVAIMTASPLGFTRLCALSVSVLLASGPFLHGAPAATWSSSPDLPTDLVRATGIYFPANGRFYAMGGRTSDAAGADMPTPYEFDPSTNAWVFKTAPFPDNQVNNMACGVLSAGKTPYIYCVGGSATGSTAATTRVFRYDPVADKIETAGIQPWNESTPDTLPGGFTVFENKLYILGGLSLGTSATNRIFEFIPDNAVGSQWARKAATLPVALSFVPATTIGSLIFTAGGSTFTPCTLTETSNAYVYDPVRDSISSIANLPRTTGETRAVTVANEMWVLGGGRTAPNPSAEVNIYNPETGKWRVAAPLSTGQRNFAAASDGVRVFMAGGYNSTTTPLKTAQIYGETSQVSPALVLVPEAGTGARALADP